MRQGVGCALWAACALTAFCLSIKMSSHFAAGCFCHLSLRAAGGGGGTEGVAGAEGGAAAAEGGVAVVVVKKNDRPSGSERESVWERVSESESERWASQGLS